MAFCPHCGAETELAIPVAAPIAEAVNSEVEIARINAERDVKVAQISARQEKDWNETRVEVATVEAEAEVAAAEATAEVIGEVLAADAEPEPDPEPIVIDAPTVEDEVVDDAPPENDGPAPHEPSKPRGLGFW